MELYTNNAIGNEKKRDLDLKRISIRISFFEDGREEIYYTQSFNVFEDSEGDFVRDIVTYLNRPAETAETIDGNA